MPFDAVGFPIDQVARGANWSWGKVWRGLRARLRDAVGRSEPEATVAMLRQARALIGEPGRWMQGAYERGGRRCAMGALHAAGRNARRVARRDAADALLAVAGLHGHHSVESMNDSATHAEVLAMFDTAIARAGLGLRRSF